MVSALAELEKSTGDKTSDFQWDRIVDMVSGAFRFTSEETERFRSREIPKLIAAIPFLAGCKDPLRTAISHLGTYILSVRLPEVANTKPSDDEYLFRRLECINHFIGGDKDIIQRGMNLIALCMVSDYERDIDEDRKLGKYNPISTGNMNSEELRHKLFRQIESVQCDEMDVILPVKNSWLEYFWLI